MTAINSNRAIRGPVTAIPVVAGKGVRLVADTENNRIVAEADETVLFNGTAAASVTCSESVSNFERIQIWVNVNSDGSRKASIELIPGYESEYLFYSGIANNLMHLYGGVITASSTTVAVNQGRHMWVSTGGSNVSSEAQTRNIYKIVGINRIRASN